jgi:cobalt-zinc-cadmium efflux system outer membrane protein
MVLLGCAQAATAAPTVREAWQAALALHPTRAYAQSLDESAEMVEADADRWLGNPASVATRYNTDRIADDIGEQEWEVILNLPLMTPGERASRQSAAEGTRSAAAANHRVLELQVAGEVRRLLWDVHVAMLEQELAQRALASTRRLVDHVRQLVAAGSRARNELLAVEADLLEREQALIDAEAELEHMQWRWLRLTGLEQVPLGQPETQAAGEHDGLLMAHPVHHWREAELATARASEALQGSTWVNKPTLGLGYRGERGSRFEDEIQSLGLFFEVPLDFGQYNRRAEASAHQQAGEAALNLSLTQRQLKQQLHDAELRIESERRALQLAQRRDEIAREAASLAELAFDNGESSLFELLDAKERARRAWSERGRRQLSLAEAISLFNQAAGVLPE